MSDLTKEANSAVNPEAEGVTIILAHHGQDQWGTFEKDPTTGAKKIPLGFNQKESQLSEFGETQASSIGKYLIENGLVPDCATIVGCPRTEKTFEEMNLGIEDKHVLADEELYDADVDQLGSEIQMAGMKHSGNSEAKTFLLVARKPNIHDLAKKFADPDSADAIDKAVKDHENGTVVVVNLPQTNSFVDIYDTEQEPDPATGFPPFKKGTVRIIVPDNEGSAYELGQEDSVKQDLELEEP